MSNKCVLLCDDDEGIVDVSTIVLEEKGYCVIALTNPKQVLSTVAERRPDIILLDLWMPVISGEVLARELKLNPDTRHIPIIIISASKDTERIAGTVAADDFLCKPFDIEALEQMVFKHVQ